MPEEPERPTTGPIFVIGSQGSGTTLMRLILDSHEDFALAQETGFMRAALAQLTVPFHEAGRDWYLRLGWSETEMHDQLRGFYERIFARFAASQGARRWGDKTPYHIWHVPELAQIFPDALFLCMVRNPGGTTASVQSRFDWQVQHAVNAWVRQNTEIAVRAVQLPGRFALLRYEDLVLDPETSLRELLDWMGEPWTPRLLEHHVVHGERQPQHVEGMTSATDPIDVERVAKWTTKLDAEARDLLRTKAAPLARFYGYHVDDAMRLDSLLPADSVRRKLVTSADIARRQSEHADMDWSPRGRPAANRRLDAAELWLSRHQGKRSDKSSERLPSAAPSTKPKGSGRAAAKITRTADTGARVPILVVGSPAAGSDLVRTALDRHERLAITADSGFLRAAINHQWVPFRRSGGWYKRLGWSREEFSAELGVFYSGLFERILQSRDAQRWGDATPFHVWHLDTANELFPDAVVVGVTRHPAAVVADLVHGGLEPVRAIRQWRGATLAIVLAGSAMGQRFLLVRHEDLVEAPEETLRELLGLLGEPWSDRALEAARLHEPASNLDSLPPPVRKALRKRVGRLASLLGYDLAKPAAHTALLPATHQRRRVLTGDDLAVRRKEFPAVGRKPPTPPRVDRPLRSTNVRARFIRGPGERS